MKHLQALKSVKLLAPVSASNTAAATSSWVDITEAEGDIRFTINTGAITGGIVWTVEHATSSGGAGGAAFTPDDGAIASTTANTVQSAVVDAGAINGFVRCVGTITTGPVLVAVSVTYEPDQPSGST